MVKMKSPECIRFGWLNFTIDQPLILSYDMLTLSAMTNDIRLYCHTLDYDRQVWSVCQTVIMICWFGEGHALCWPNVAFLFDLCLWPLSSHWVNTSCLWWDDKLALLRQVHTVPANRRHWTIVGSMLVHRLRRWPNIDRAMVQCLLFAGILLQWKANNGNWLLQQKTVTAVYLGTTCRADWWIPEWIPFPPPACPEYTDTAGIHHSYYHYHQNRWILGSAHVF